ncbi:MAG: YceI family protein [Flavobacteriaceae bacterium]
MATFIVDSAHSEIGFKVKHMMFTNVSGKIDMYNASIEAENDDLDNAKIQFEGDASSISTGSTDRDNHLKSGDFFDVENFPKITFTSTSFDKNGKLTGDLTIRGVSKPVTLDVEFGGTAKDPWGNTKLGLTLTGKVNRKDWGLNWNSALETGGVLVGEEVKFNIELQFAKQ